MSDFESSSVRTIFTHCALHVRDIEASTAFYRKYCGFEVLLRHGEGGQPVAWIGPPDNPRRFVFVLVEGGAGQTRQPGDMTHYGFAVSKRGDIDRIADLARSEGRLYWEPQELPPPVGYLCAVEDPDGYIVEFSYGQPLGPGASYKLESQNIGA